MYALETVHTLLIYGLLRTICSRVIQWKMLRGCIDLKFKGHFFSNPVFDKTIQRETFRDKYSISQDLQPFFYLLPSPSVLWSPDSPGYYSYDLQSSGWCRLFRLSWRSWRSLQNKIEYSIAIKKPFLLNPDIKECTYPVARPGVPAAPPRLYNSQIKSIGLAILF